MARIRTLKPEMPGHPTIAKLSRDARLLFVWLITDADDEGRFVAAAKRLAGQLYPLDDDVTATDVLIWLGELIDCGLVAMYEHDGATYGEIVGWADHQKISKPSPSRLPRRPSANQPANPPGHTTPPPAETPGIRANTPEPPAETQADLGPRTLDQGPTLPARPEADRTGEHTDTNPDFTPKPLTPWDETRLVLGHQWPTEPADVLDRWAGELAKLAKARRIPHPYPDDIGPHVLATVLANRTLTAIGARPSLVSTPDRARLISQIEAVLRATPPDPGQPHVDTDALDHRWTARLAAMKTTRPTWTAHELATRTVATWDAPHPDPQHPHPAGTSAAAATARQKAHLHRIKEGTTP